MSNDLETLETQTPPETPEEKASKRQMSFTVLEDGQIMASFGDGVEPLYLNPGLLPESLIPSAVAEGVISRSRGYTAKLTAENRTPEKLREATARAFENLLSGIWKIERTPGESTEYTIEQEAAFVFRQMRAAARGEEFIGTLAEAAAEFAALSEARKAAVKALPRYQLARAQVKARRDAEKLAKLEKKAIENENENLF